MLEYFKRRHEKMRMWVRRSVACREIRAAWSACSSFNFWSKLRGGMVVLFPRLGESQPPVVAFPPKNVMSIVVAGFPLP
jgi:hypothetical protein